MFPLYQGRIDSNRQDFLNVALSDFPIQLFSVIRQGNLNNIVRIRRRIFFCSSEAIIFDCELRRIITLDSVCIYFLLKHVTRMCTNMAEINSVTSRENDLYCFQSSIESSLIANVSTELSSPWQVVLLLVVDLSELALNNAASSPEGCFLFRARWMCQVCMMWCLFLC